MDCDLIQAFRISFHGLLCVIPLSTSKYHYCTNLCKSFGHAAWVLALLEWPLIVFSFEFLDFFPCYHNYYVLVIKYSNPLLKTVPIVHFYFTHACNLISPAYEDPVHLVYSS